jgi:hypothetical protein
MARSKPTPVLELDKLDRQLDYGTDIVLFTDISIALGVDTRTLVRKADALSAKLLTKIAKAHDAKPE